MRDEVPRPADPLELGGERWLPPRAADRSHRHRGAAAPRASAGAYSAGVTGSSRRRLELTLRPPARRLSRRRPHARRPPPGYDRKRPGAREHPSIALAELKPQLERHATALVRKRAPLAHAPSLLALRGARLVGREQAPGRRVALTFDDGPDPKWTPRIEAVLRHFRIPATFFVVGSHVVREPGIVRRLHNEGFEIGNHTFSHVDVASVPAWERSLQLGLTENAVAGAAGVRPRLMRPPYSATPAAVLPRQLPALRDVARRGYVLALSDFDGRDWSRPGVAQIVRNASPPGPHGGLVLLHDGGGYRP